VIKPSEVYDLLPAFLFDEDQDEVAEVKESFYLLPPLQQQILRYAYEDDLGDEEIAHIYGISKHQARQRVIRAVLALTQLMNEDPYEAGMGQWDTRSKGRKAMSNAAARRLTGGYWGD
jgi:DNA-directed RNA polymerase specialized sigma24 family protein